MLLAANHFDVFRIQHGLQTFNGTLQKGIFSDEFDQLFGIELSGDRPQSGPGSARQ